MKLDPTNIKLEGVIQSINDAPLEDKGKAIAEALQTFSEAAQEATVQQFKAEYADVQAHAETALKYGLRQLSSSEKTFIEKLMDPKQLAGAFKDTENDLLLPETITSYIFEDIQRDHPLLKYVDFSPAGLKKILLSEKAGKATWGELDSKITAELTATLNSLDIDVHKLSAFAFIPRAIVAMGHAWIEKYIRLSLTEAVVEGLEEGAISGDGKNSPVGINRKLTGAIDGVHAKRTAIKITDFSIESLGNHMVTLSDDGRRKTPLVLLLVNPTDALTKVAAASRFLTPTGAWANVFPYNIEVIESLGVEVGEAILYLPNSYKMGVSKQAIEYSDSFQFLEDNRVFKIVTYANGRLVKENQAVLLDITDLKPLAFNVAINSEDIGA